VTRVRRLVSLAMVPLVLTGAALALRLWGIQHGLPHPMGRPDELQVLDYTAGFGSGDWEPRWFIYPTFYFHVVYAWDQAALAIWRLWRERPDYFTLVKTNLAPLLLAGRTFSATTGALVVPVMWAIGRRTGGRLFAAVAAALVAGNYLLVRDAHALKPDAPLALGLLASLGLLARYAEAPTRRRAIAAGVAIGLTTAIKYNGVLLIIPALMADAIAPAPRARRFLPRVETWLLCVVAGVAFLAACPFLVLDWQRTWDTFLIANWNLYVTRPEALPPPDATLGERLANLLTTRSFGYHVAVSLRYGCGLAALLVMPIGLAMGFGRRAHPAVRLSAVFAIVCFLVAGASPVKLARYVAPAVPFVLLVVAAVVVRAVEVVPSHALRAVAAGLATAFLLAEPIGSSVAFDRIASRTDTRVLTSEWFAARPSATVAVLGAALFPTLGPVLLPPIRKVPLRIEPGALDAGKITHVVLVTHDALAFFTHATLGDLGPLVPRLRLVQTFSPFAGEPAGLFEAEDAFYVPFADFRGVVRPGPIVHIYEVTPPR
jgi:4-amino-4-deoxy-L-arabinose transferase-like glycosyltransferase